MDGGVEDDGRAPEESCSSRYLALHIYLPAMELLLEWTFAQFVEAVLSETTSMSSIRHVEPVGRALPLPWRRNPVVPQRKPHHKQIKVGRTNVLSRLHVHRPKSRNAKSRTPVLNRPSKLRVQ